MPSFRISLAVIAAGPTVPPEDVLPVFAQAVSAEHYVEDAFVDVAGVLRGGPPRPTVRFEIPHSRDEEEDSQAWHVARIAATALGQIAQWRDLRVHRRQSGRWVEAPHPGRGPD